MKHLIEIFTAFLEIFVLYSFVYAWPILVFILRKEAVYGELCDEIAENGPCQAQHEIYVRNLKSNLRSFKKILAPGDQSRLFHVFPWMSFCWPFPRQVRKNNFENTSLKSKKNHEIWTINKI